MKWRKFLHDSNNIFCVFHQAKKTFMKVNFKRKFPYTQWVFLMVIVFLKYKRCVLLFRVCVTWCGFDSIKRKLEEGQKSIMEKFLNFFYCRIYASKALHKKLKFAFTLSIRNIKFLLLLGHLFLCEIEGTIRCTLRVNSAKKLFSFSNNFLTIFLSN